MVREATLRIIRLPDWTALLWTAEISKAMIPEPSNSHDPDSLIGVGGTAARRAAAAMEGGMMMINVVTTLNTCPFTVDKNKAKASSRQHPPQQRGSEPSQGSGPPDVVPASAIEGGRTDQNIQQLKGLLAASNCRFEAFAVVLQQILTEVRIFYFQEVNSSFFVVVLTFHFLQFATTSALFRKMGV